VLEAVESGALELARVAQGVAVKLDVGEVLEQDVVGLDDLALELLAG
jgi:hypothetical protein